MKPKIICFIGCDGSGKSTLVREARQIFETKSVPCTTAWACYKLVAAKPFMTLAKCLWLRKKNIYDDYRSYKDSLSRITRRKWLIAIYYALLFPDYAFQIFLKVRIPHFFGKIVILDRYFYDTAVSIAANRELNEKEFFKLISALSCIAIQPDTVFYVDTPVDVCLSRKGDIPHRDFLERRIHYYEALKKMSFVEVIPGTMAIKKLRRILEDRLIDKLA